MTSPGSTVRTALVGLGVASLGAAGACGKNDRACEETLTCAAGPRAGAGGSSAGGGGKGAGGAGGKAGSAGSTSGGESGESGAAGGFGGDEGGSDGGGNGGGAGEAGIGAAGSAGSGGTPECSTTLCCVSGVVQRSGSCGTACTCSSSGDPTETQCTDGMDTDDDGDTDFADSDCDSMPCAVGATVDVPVDKDVWITQASPGSSFNGPNIDIGVSDSGVQVGFIGVDGLNLGGIQLSKAELRLYMDGHEGDDQATLTLRIHEVTGGWTETLTWGAAYTGDPPADTPLLFDDAAIVTSNSVELHPCGPSDIGCVVEDAWYTFDVTSLVTEWADGSAMNRGFAITGVPNNNGPGNLYFFRAREETNPALRPVLRVTYDALWSAQQNRCPSPLD